MRPKSVIYLTTSLMLLLWQPGFASEMSVADRVRETAEQYVRDNLEPGDYHDLVIRANAIDPRLNLADCPIPLESFSNSSRITVGRSTVGIRCRGDKPWTLYVPVTVDAMVDVLVAATSLTRGSLLAPGQLESEKRAVDRLPRNYLEADAATNGLELTRAVTAGTVITLNMLKARKLVQKGQQVMILASGDSFQVRMSGTALGAGMKGDLIPVRNSTSGRTVEARIVDARNVEVKL